MLLETSTTKAFPVCLGDTVYTNFAPQGWYLRKSDMPYQAKVVFIGISEDPFFNVEYAPGKMWQFKFSDLGKQVFLTEHKAIASMRATDTTPRKAMTNPDRCLVDKQEVLRVLSEVFTEYGISWSPDRKNNGFAAAVPKVIQDLPEAGRTKEHPYTVEELESLIRGVIAYEDSEPDPEDTLTNLEAMGFSEDQMFFFGFDFEQEMAEFVQEIE